MAGMVRGIEKSVHYSGYGAFSGALRLRRQLGCRRKVYFFIVLHGLGGGWRCLSIWHGFFSIDGRIINVF
jgi:hypothetical protein